MSSNSALGSNLGRPAQPRPTSAVSAGRATAAPSPKVGHFNRTVGGVDPAAGIDRGAMNNDIGAESAMGTSVKLTKATDEQSTADHASVIGIRVNAGWTLCWQGPRTWIGIHNNEKSYEVPADMLHQCDNNG